MHHHKTVSAAASVGKSQEQAETLNDFYNGTLKSPRRIHVPTGDPALDEIDLEATLDFLFHSGTMERPRPRNRNEQFTDWFTDNILGRFRSKLDTAESA